MVGNLKLIIVYNIYPRELELVKKTRISLMLAFWIQNIEKGMKSFKLVSSMKKTYFRFLFLDNQTSHEIYHLIFILQFLSAFTFFHSAIGAESLRITP